MNKYEKMYEDILLAVKTGEVVIVKDKRGKFIAIGGAGFDDDGHPRESECWNSIKYCKNKLGEDSGSNKEDFIQRAKGFSYQIVETYTPEYDRVPVGTKVMITDQNDKTTGSICTIIEQIDGTQYGIERPDRYLPLCLPRSAFTVILPEVENKHLGENLLMSYDTIKKQSIRLVSGTEKEPKTITLDGVEYILTPKQNG
jgi:hypothetical protein